MNSHKLNRLQNSLLNTPHMATPSVLDNCIQYLESRNSGEFELSVSKTNFSNTNKQLNYNATTKTGVISIDGPLLYRSTVLTALCNLTSYQQLISDVQNLADQGAQRIVLLANSGGGEALACFDTANQIRTIADANGIKLTAFVDGIAGSACYALISVCDEIISASDSEIGSIGVVVKLVNKNKAMQNAGINELYITAGESKIPFNANGDWQEGFLEDLQVKVSALYETFTEHVATNRNISVASVKATEAKMFMAQDALALGLVDKVMSRMDFQDYLSKDKSLPKATPQKPTQAVVAPASKTSTTPLVIQAETKPKSNDVVKLLSEKYLRIEQKPLRLKRLLKSFHPEAANSILNSTQHLSAEEFESKISTLEKDFK